jgi:hypothetical protein
MEIAEGISYVKQVAVATIQTYPFALKSSEGTRSVKLPPSANGRVSAARSGELCTDHRLDAAGQPE